MGLRVCAWKGSCAAAALAAACIAPAARAGGLWIYEAASPDMGRAEAGSAAEALDASVSFRNPAGMTRIEGSQLVGGLLGIFGDTKFDVDAAGFGGDNGGDAAGFTPSLSSFYVHKPFETEWLKDLRLGVSAGSFFGAGLDYDSSWAGRYYATEVEFLTLGVNPALAYRVTDWLSVGAGFSALFGRLGIKTAINNLLDMTGDGKLKYDDSDFGFGGDAGILIEPWETTRIGVSYRSPVKFEFEDEPRLTNVGPLLRAALALTGNRGANLKTEWTIPQTVTASIYHELTERLAVMASVGWQDWSEFGQPEITVQSATTTSLQADLDFKDTWHGALGFRYRLGEPWILSLGFAYDTAALATASKRSPIFPIDRQIRYAAGVQYEWSKSLTLGVAYTYLDAGEASINRSGTPFQGPLKGDYTTNRVQFVNLNAVWNF